MSEDKQEVEQVDAVDTPEADQAEVSEATEEAQATEAPSVEALQQQLEEAQAKAEDHWNKFVRAQAEMENLRRRSEREVENAHKYSLEKIVSELLPVVDSLEMGVAASDGLEGEAAKLHEGSVLTLKMLMGVLEKFNIQQVDPQGEKFNPELHQAMSMQATDECEPNTVVTVYQKGYVLNDRLVRPAMVVVSKAADGASSNTIDEHA